MLDVAVFFFAYVSGDKFDTFCESLKIIVRKYFEFYIIFVTELLPDFTREVSHVCHSLKKELASEQISNDMRQNTYSHRLVKKLNVIKIAL